MSVHNSLPVSRTSLVRPSFDISEGAIARLSATLAVDLKPRVSTESRRQSAQQHSDAHTRMVRWQIAIVVLIYFGSIGIMICRRSISVVIPAMREDPVVNLTSRDAGILLSIGSLANLIGEFSSGVLVAKLGGKIPFLLAGSITSVGVLVFSFMKALPLFMVVLFIMRFFQSASFPSQVRLVSVWFPPHIYGRIWGIVASSSRVGAATSGLLMGALQSNAGLSWSQVLWVASAALALATVLNLVLLRPQPESVGLALADASSVRISEPINAASTKPEHNPRPARTLRVMLLSYAKEPRFWLICAGSFTADLCFEFDLFVPMYLVDMFGLDPGKASMASAVFPVGMMISLLAGGFLLDKLSRKQGAFLLVALLCVTLVVTVALWIMALMGGTLASAIPLVFLYGLTLGAPCYLPQSLFALRLGGPAECGVILALIEACEWTASLGFDFISGFLPGWSATFAFLTGSAVLTIAAFTGFFVLDLRDSGASTDMQPQLLEEEDDHEGGYGRHGYATDGSQSSDEHSSIDVLESQGKAVAAAPMSDGVEMGVVRSSRTSHSSLKQYLS